MSELPDGWEWSTLGEVGRYLNGRGFKKTEWAETGRPIIRIQNLTGSTGVTNYFDGRADERHVVRRGDLLVSWAATLGVFIWDGPEAVLNQHIFKVESYIDNDYHRYLLENVLADLRRQAHGSGMVHVTKSKFDETPVPVPPIPEQRRIFATIEQYFSRIDAAEAGLVSAARRTELLAQSAIDSSLRGPNRKLGDVLAEPLRNGLSAKASPSGTTRVLTLTAVTDNSFTDQNTKLIDKPGRSMDDLWLRPNDIFVQRSNTPELVGTAAIYKGPAEWAIFPDLLIRVRVGDAVRADYVALALQSSAVRSYFRRSAQGIAGSMPKISQPIVEQAEIPLPSVHEQDEVIARYGAASEEVFRLEAEARTARRRLRALRRSILAAAFTGKLVPQNPSDEPASVLLERIVGQRSKPASQRIAAAT